MNMKQLKELSNLIKDSLKNQVVLYSENASKFADEAVRAGFFEILGEEKLTWQNFENNYRAIFTVMENVLKSTLPDAWESSPFFNQFVEIKRGDLGQKNEFYVEDNSVIIASTFSGNHWDTDRQKVQGKRSFSTRTGWIYVRIYNDLERFLTQNDSLIEMVNKLRKAFQNEIDGRIYASFNAVGNLLPADFKETGTYDKDTMNNLIEKVQTYSQKEVVIAGTRTALGQIADGINTSWIANSQKEELATTGMVVENIGLPAKAIVIPQTFIRGTTDFKVKNNLLHILPQDSKIIKLYYEGEVRAKKMDEKETHDQTIDIQAQLRYGLGGVCDSITGCYELV